ncbi:hypothetical protein KI387_039142 [Taxus chinensis]|uniref:Uncharacterized protein n=1 Tax=Taxus chinensis TaxID=29808 RepID=A0AA38F7K1_TAXCH|nr:hypothetical protein KI387_039142 [Taxus chinensis]
MGNAVAPSRGAGRVKIMKLDGEIIKFNCPLTVAQLLLDYPNHVVMDSDAVRHVGIKAQPLEGSTQLKAKKLYFLLEMPGIENLRAPGRVRSEIKMSAKSQLEAMLLARRSSSDISPLTSSVCRISGSPSSINGDDGAVRVKVRLTKAQLSQLTEEGDNSSETAAKILDFCLKQDGESQNSETSSQNLTENQDTLNSSGGSCKKTARNRVRFSSNIESLEVS